jgi:hypothetical protein
MLLCDVVLWQLSEPDHLKESKHVKRELAAVVFLRLTHSSQREIGLPEWIILALANKVLGALKINLLAQVIRTPTSPGIPYGQPCGLVKPVFHLIMLLIASQSSS